MTQTLTYPVVTSVGIVEMSEAQMLRFQRLNMTDRERIHELECRIETLEILVRNLMERNS